jgi:recombination protein RecA
MNQCTALKITDDREQHQGDSYVEKAVETVDKHQAVYQLRDQLANQLVSLEQLRPPAGLPLGIEAFDEYLWWKGFPKGDLTLLNGKPGSGATSLWVHAAAKVHIQNKWAAWVNSSWEILPSYLVKKGIDLKRLLVVRKPEDDQHLFWVLQELMTSGLFEIVGIHLDQQRLKAHQLQKLKKLARVHNVGLVFVSHSHHCSNGSAKYSTMNPQLFSLVIECSRDQFVLKRALHRATPHSISGANIHADLMYQLTANSRSQLR